MATNFPSSLDSLTNPTSTDALNSPSHADQHANVNDAVEALEAKVGVDGSAVTSSLDFKVTASKTVTDKIDPAGASADQVLKFNGTKFVPATGSSLTASDTPPGSPVAGELWYESDTGRTFIRYDSAWVEIGSTATTNVNANDLSGTTLASNVVSSSLTSVGTITNLQATAATINGWLVSQPGLVLVKTQAVGSGVTSVDVTSCFSSSYENYKVTYTNGSGSTTGLITLQFLSGSTPSTTGYHGGAAWINVGGGTWQLAADNNTSQWNYAGGTASTYAFASFELLQPFLAKQTVGNGTFSQLDNGRTGQCFLHHAVATSYDGLRFGISAGTLTGGTIRVYGYRNS